MDYEKASEDLLSEIVRQAEARLAVQAQFALAADQRALSLTNLYGSMTAGLLTVAIGALSGGYRPIAFAAAGAGLFVFIATLLVVAAAKPSPFATVGNDPENWKEDIEAGRSLHQARADTAGIYNAALKKNRGRMKTQTRLINSALMMMLLAGPAAAGAGLAGWLAFP
ncbi:MAG: hypothetical protein QM773_05875 [Hyphomonadaceae bacterium]